jgi:hypothetical protein
MEVELPKEEEEEEKTAEKTLVRGESMESSPSTSSYETVGTDFIDCPMSPKITSVIVTDASIDVANSTGNNEKEDEVKENLETLHEEIAPSNHNSLDALQEPKSACVSPASSNGGIYSVSETILDKKIDD